MSACERLNAELHDVLLRATYSGEEDSVILFDELDRIFAEMDRRRCPIPPFEELPY